MNDFQESKGRPTKEPAGKISRQPHSVRARSRVEEDLALLEEIRALDGKNQDLLSPAERLEFEAALKDMRLEEAAFLIREAASLAESGCDFENFIETGEFADEGAPQKSVTVGALWRFPTAIVEGTRASLHVVGSPDAKRQTFAKPHATLTSRNGQLSAQSGSFIVDPKRSIWLSAAHAHDLVLIVVRGSVRIGREGTTEGYVVRADHTMLGICHLAAGSAFNAPFVIEAVGEQAATAIWAIACEPELEQSNERQLLPPLCDRTSAIPWGVEAAENASPLPLASNARYAHKNAIREGLFDRYDLLWSGERNERIVRGCETAVRLIATRSQPTSHKRRKTEIDLTIHEGLELILPVSGGFWLWTSTKGHDTPQDGDNTAGVTLSIFSKDRDEKQAYALDLITAGSSSQQFATDVLLLDSSISHTMATLDSVVSACLHVSFMPLAGANQARLPAPVETDEKSASNVTSLSEARRARK